ncbi:hypothetical protein [Maribacter sp. Asnod2-G09]|uniref:hypothetical protein n=1 Tax=Maribacter sp. Asnod2-G09 TaxID=3160577 RepID=UPI003863946D
MNLVVRIVFFTFLIVPLISCGRKETEKDKHPELPFFPETTDTKIKFEKIDFYPDSFYKIDETYFNIGAKLNEHSPLDIYIFSYKDDLTTKTDSILLDNDHYYIEESGFLYSYNFSSKSDDEYYENNKVTRINIKTGKKKHIDYLKYDYGEEHQNIFEINRTYEKQLTHLSDSLVMEIRSKRIDSVEREINKKFKSTILKGLQKVTEISLQSNHHSFLLQYENREVILKNAPFWHNETEEGRSPIDLLKDYKEYKPLKNSSLEITENIHVFDRAVQGNYLGGGRFNTNLSQSGIQYYELNFKNEKTSFKLEAKNLYDDEIIVTYLMPDKKTIILYSNEEQFKLSL